MSAMLRKSGFYWRGCGCNRCDPQRRKIERRQGRAIEKRQWQRDPESA